MPRAPWRRFRATDAPRPAGRRWAGRLRRSGSLARQVFLVGPIGRIGRRRTDQGVSGGTALGLPVDVEFPDSGVRRGRLASIRRSRKVDAAPRAQLSGQPGAQYSPTFVGGPLPVPVSPAVAATGSPPSGPLRIPLLPGERTRARRIRFALVNACTLASLSLGMAAIFLAFNAHDIRAAALCLIGCVVFDGLDGALARKLGVASPFGAQMDSMADMCSFGVAAPVVVYSWLRGSAPTAMIAAACGLVAICAAIRLARFNVSPKDGRFFCGVPTTMVAAALALGALISPSMPAWLQISGVSMLGLAMVSSFPYAKFARLLRLPLWLLVVPVIGALVDYQVTYGLVVLAYLVSGPLIWLRHRHTEASLVS